MKPGDVVKIVGPSGDAPKDWAVAMNNVIGFVVEIAKKTAPFNCHYLLFPFELREFSLYYFHEDWLIKVGERIKFRKSEFNTGDQVQILNPYSYETKRFQWIQKMDNLIGSVHVIDSIENNEDEDDYLIDHPNHSHKLYFHENWLTKSIKKLGPTSFSRGDVVVAKRPKPSEREKSPQWTNLMDKLDGKHGKVVCVNEGAIVVKFYVSNPFKGAGFRHSFRCFGFQPEWLEHAEKVKEIVRSNEDCLKSMGYDDKIIKDFQDTREYGIFTNFEEKQLRIFQELVNCFPSCLAIRDNAFDDMDLKPGFKACIFIKDVPYDKIAKIKMKLETIKESFNECF